MLTLTLLVVAGGLGAVARFVVDGAVRARWAPRFPLGTILINLTGSFLLGLLTGVVASRVVPEPALTVLGTGFLGGYTTFSTASFDTVRLIGEHRWWAALGNTVGVLLGSTALAAIGFWLGRS